MKKFILGTLLSLSFIQSAFAATTTLTFDDIAAGTLVDTQYQGVGVVADGVTVLNEAELPWPANTSPNVGFAHSGFMNFYANSSITGNIQTVSTYAYGDSIVEMYAYDSSGSLVGQAVTSGAPNNTLLTVSSSGNPIARVYFIASGLGFAIDTLSFETAPDVPVCTVATQDLRNAVSALSLTQFKSYKKAQDAKDQMLKDIDSLQTALDANSSNAKLLLKLRVIEGEVSNGLKSGPARTDLLNMINQIKSLINANQC